MTKTIFTKAGKPPFVIELHDNGEVWFAIAGSRVQANTYGACCQFAYDFGFTFSHTYRVAEPVR